MRLARSGNNALVPFFLGEGQGKRFCIHRPPQARFAGAFVFLHSFGEEMNKARRTVALGADALARAGYAVLQIDLMGCGDSEGQLRDVRWAHWREDAANAVSWMQREYDGAIGIWGVRLGAILACDVSFALGEQSGPIILWSPVVNGRTFMRQFLRIGAAGAALGRTEYSHSQENLRSRLAKGDTVEVGGYQISPELLADLEALQLAEYRPRSAVIWCDVAGEDAVDIAPASKAVIELWEQSAVSIKAAVVTSADYWVGIDIVEARALIPFTINALSVAT